LRAILPAKLDLGNDCGANGWGCARSRTSRNGGTRMDYGSLRAIDPTGRLRRSLRYLVFARHDGDGGSRQAGNQRRPLPPSGHVNSRHPWRSPPGSPRCSKRQSCRFVPRCAGEGKANGVTRWFAFAPCAGGGKDESLPSCCGHGDLRFCDPAGTFVAFVLLYIPLGIREVDNSFSG
jgi:hypothetical protein